ncbi:MAG TPA: UDP-N-acetylmuramate dehydrogenase [Patescibacteria group bacterium]|nr:UDP-N-acetylmuramate dehydrogenase [Patescibacteria group bacterium]
MRPVHEGLEKKLGKGRVKKDYVLGPYTSFKMGGAAQFYFEAKTEEDLISSRAISHVLGTPYIILGGASNVVVSDAGVKGLVVKNLYIHQKIVKQDSKTVLICVSSGYPATKFAKETAEKGYAGLEYHTGLPGTVGGAIYMNSKWYCDPANRKNVSYFGDNLLYADIFNEKGVKRRVYRDYFHFAYDFSILQKTREILINAFFSLKKEPQADVLARSRNTFEYRKKTQPQGAFSSGCFFKNPEGWSVGRLIDEAGLKGESLGNFYISNSHGNFIIHKGRGNMEDLKRLIARIKDTVYKKYGIALEEEVIMIE